MACYCCSLLVVLWNVDRLDAVLQISEELHELHDFKAQIDVLNANDLADEDSDISMLQIVERSLARQKRIVAEFYNNAWGDSLQDIRSFIQLTHDLEAGLQEKDGKLLQDLAGSDAKPKVLLRRYRTKMQKSGSSLPRVELEELGPSMSLSLDRTRDPDKDKWKQSIKVPKAAKPKKVKNVKTTEMGKTVGKFHLGKQDFNQIHTVHHGASKKRKLAESLGKDTPGEPKSKRSAPTPAEA
eukprot:symbB.v1.2.014435.t1/scaffold1054.1/size141114/7